MQHTFFTEIQILSLAQIKGFSRENVSRFHDLRLHLLQGHPNQSSKGLCFDVRMSFGELV